jgi:ubiquinone/menaquinone biosynthesis C-methylase UbiE
VTHQTSVEIDPRNPAVNYERFFVPAIGEPLARALIELAELRPGERVVDVACGTGLVTKLAAEQVGRAAVAGVDVNPGMLAVARDVASDSAIEWHEASAEGLPLGDGTFDVAFCQMGLQFFPDRPGALRELRRVLTPGGRVVLNVPGPRPALFAPLEDALRRHLGPEAAGFVATVFSLHDTGEIRSLLEEAGFADALARSERRTLHLPAADEFLWQYVYSTPLAAAAASSDDRRRADLQRDVVAAWEPFAENGGLALEVDVTSATARAT